ncbi:MAG: hypothetical protein V1859_00605 [archaeon]
MLDEEDMNVLESMKEYRAKKRRSFTKVINSSKITDSDLDEFFLGD